MKTKHILIEILPRAAWIIVGICLYLGQNLSHQSPILTTNFVKLIFGIGLSLVGTVLLILSFRFLFKAMFTKDLVVGGIYRYVRHPMYTSIYLLLIGLGLLFFSNIWFLILLVFIPVWYLIARAEEWQMTDLYGEKYSEYKKKTEMFLPKI